MMRLIKYFVGKLFFIHYYACVVAITFLNFMRYLTSIFCLKVNTLYINPFSNTHPLVFANAQQFALLDGYTLQIYQFKSSDNQQLSVWRLKKQNSNLQKPYPVLLMHGLLDCSGTWFVQSEKSKSLPYVLAQSGYDVWIGNNRGSRNNIKTQKEQPSFWNHTLDHLILYDFPAIVSGVLRQTLKQKIIYIGHSQGSAEFLFGIGQNKELESRIHMFVGLGCLVNLRHANDFIVLHLLDKFGLLQILNCFNFRKIFVLTSQISKAIGFLVDNSKVHFNLILFLVRLICGFNQRNKISQLSFCLTVTHTPGGSSLNNILQWLQCRRNGQMRKFDYGQKQNLKIYGQKNSPIYSLDYLKQAQFKSLLYRGGKDAIVSKQNFSELLAKFNQRHTKAIEVPDYHHLEYVWSECAKQDIYDGILQELERQK